MIKRNLISDLLRNNFFLKLKYCMFYSISIKSSVKERNLRYKQIFTIKYFVDLPKICSNDYHETRHGHVGIHDSTRRGSYKKNAN